MTRCDGTDATPDDEVVCDCGYRSRGHTLTARIRDAQHHAGVVHGIDVTAEQVLVHGEGGTT